MARLSRSPGLDAPRTGRRTRPAQPDSDRFGRFTEWVARAMGTPAFLLILTAFCLFWVSWNILAPEFLRFDSQVYGFTVLTLVLSLQASYAAPLILLAQNRQDDRDRVQIEQDRQRAERNLADTEYLAREIVALRIAMTEVTDEVVTRDVLRSELRALLAELEERTGTADEGERSTDAGGPADSPTTPTTSRAAPGGETP